MAEIIRGAEPFYFRGGPTGVLLIHVFTGSPAEMRPLGERLAQQGYAVFCPRLAGHGTDPMDMRKTLWPDWQASAAEGLTFLLAECAKVFVVGFSMGGLIALHLAVGYPQLAGIVVLNAPIWLVNKKAALAPLLRFFRLFVGKGEASSYPEESTKYLIGYRITPISCLISLLENIKLVRGEIPLVSQPALVVQSRADRTVDPKSANYIFQHLASADKNLIWLERSGHMVTVGEEKEQVFTAVADWLAAH